MKELWKSCPRFKFYCVSNLGRMKSMGRTIVRCDGWSITIQTKVLNPTKTKKGYPAVKISGKTVRVDHQVLEAFRGPRPSGLVSRHLDDVKTNNKISNLRWGTRRENYDDGIRNGSYTGNHLDSRGEANPSAKITDNTVRKVRSLHTTKGLKQSEVADKLGLSRTLVNRIILRRTWRHVV